MKVRLRGIRGLRIVPVHREACAHVAYLIHGSWAAPVNNWAKPLDSSVEPPCTSEASERAPAPKAANYLGGEPPIRGRGAKPLDQSVERRKWWALQGSNLRHSACKADALPTELSARFDNRKRAFPSRELGDYRYRITKSTVPAHE